MLWENGRRSVYIDLDFYKMLEKRFGAPGEFAKAYVVAHEIGHHAQNLLGISSKVRAAMERSSRERANQLSVRQELQADCYAGIWANHANRSRQRVRWFRRGLESGELSACDTFKSGRV